MDLKFLEGDLVVNNLNKLEAVKGIEKAKQHIWFILKMVMGSNKFNEDFGVDYRKIKQSIYNQNLVKHEIRKALLAYDKVKRIDGIEVSQPDSNRNVKMSLQLTLDEGKVVTEVVI